MCKRNTQIHTCTQIFYTSLPSYTNHIHTHTFFSIFRTFFLSLSFFLSIFLSLVARTYVRACNVNPFVHTQKETRTYNHTRTRTGMYITTYAQSQIRINNSTYIHVLTYTNISLFLSLYIYTRTYMQS